ncbi:MAG: flagellar protein FlaG [Gammaproteobacteria bacterium]|nr:flagellar protein FlaG [Gammaproteobacteria bacterium]
MNDIGLENLQSISLSGLKPAVSPVIKSDSEKNSETVKNQQPIALKESSKVDESELKLAMNQIDDLMKNMQRELSFSVDKESGKTVVKVMDAQTREVIRQMPSEEALKLAQRIKEGHDFEGMLLNSKV